MKALILALLLLLIPVSAQAMGPFKCWVCTQIAHIDGKDTMVISEVAQNNWRDYKNREKAFVKKLKETFKDRMTKSFDANCFDFREAKQARDTLEFILKKSENHGFQVIRIQFNYKGTNHAQQEQER